MKFLSLFFVLSSSAFAQAAAPQKSPSLVEMLVMPVGFLAIMYFLVIRPQQKRAKAQQVLVTNLKPGDEVVTASGMLGKIRSINENIISLEIAGNTVVKMLKSSVSGPANPPQPAVPAKK